MYIQMNVTVDRPGQSIAEMFAEVWEIVAENEIAKFIIDLRYNGGGNLFNTWPIIFKIKQYEHIDNRNTLMILTGRGTFSAATAFLSMLETHTNAVFIGEPSGGRPNQSEGGRPVQLETIGVAMVVSSGLWVHTQPSDSRDYIRPDVLIPSTFVDFREGNDPLLEAALAFSR